MQSRSIKIPTLNCPRTNAYNDKPLVMFRIGTSAINDGRPVAAFDLDHTLVKPKGKTKFSKDADDFEFITHWSVVECLRTLARDHQIVVFTNQLHEKNGARQKTINIAQALESQGIHVTVYASTEDDFYRKPRLGLYETFKQDFPDAGPMYYCGDAAGRDKDFSASDYAFAANAGIPFVLPEDLFASVKDSCEFNTYTATKFPRCIQDNKAIPAKPGTLSQADIVNTIKTSRRPDGMIVVLMLGSPASGKTTCAKAISSEFSVGLVSKDDYPTPAKSFRKFKEHITKRESVVIDGCHATLESRKKYMDVVLRTQGLQWFVISAITDKDTSFLLNQRRAWDTRSKPIPTLVSSTRLPSREAGMIP